MKDTQDTLPFLGLYIKNIRQKRGATISEIAFKADISRAHLSLIEKGQRHPGINILLKICVALETHLHELFFKIHIDLNKNTKTNCINDDYIKDDYLEIRTVLSDAESILSTAPKRLAN